MAKRRLFEEILDDRGDVLDLDWVEKELSKHRKEDMEKVKMTRQFEVGQASCLSPQTGWKPVLLLWARRALAVGRLDLRLEFVACKTMNITLCQQVRH